MKSRKSYLLGGFLFLTITVINSCSPDPLNSLNEIEIGSSTEFASYMGEIAESYLIIKTAISNLDNDKYYHLLAHLDGVFEEPIDTMALAYCANFLQPFCVVDLYDLADSIRNATDELYQTFPELEFATYEQIDSTVTCGQIFNTIPEGFPWTDNPILKTDSLGMCLSHCTKVLRRNKALNIVSTIWNLGMSAALTLDPLTTVVGVLGFPGSLMNMVYCAHHDQEAYNACVSQCHEDYD